VFWGYMLGAVLMIAAGVVQAFLGIEAARKDLEEIATPLSAEAAEAADEAEPEPAREELRYERKPTRPRSDRFRHLGPSEAGYSYSPVQQSSSRARARRDPPDAARAVRRRGGGRRRAALDRQSSIPASASQARTFSGGLPSNSARAASSSSAPGSSSTSSRR
jgi:hypothetical protein